MKSLTKFFSTTLWMSTGILFLSVGLFLVSCESAGSDDPPPPTLTAVSATEIDRNTAPLFHFSSIEHRVHFALLSLSASEAGSYTLGLRATAAAAPSATELVNAGGVIVRSLDSTAINVMLGFHMDASIFAGNFDFDAFKASGDGSADVWTSILQENTAYTLYATKSDGSSPVQAVMTLTTDAAPTTGDYLSFPINVDSGSTSIEYTLKEGEPFIFTFKSLMTGTILVPALLNVFFGGDNIRLSYPGGALLYGTTDIYWNGFGFNALNNDPAAHWFVLSPANDNKLATALYNTFEIGTPQGSTVYTFTQVQ